MTNLEELKVNIEEIKNEYLKQLEELKSKIEELEQEHESEDETDNRWKPKENEDYFLVGTNAFIFKNKWYNHDLDNDTFNHIDIFPTEEQAIFDRERKRIRRELMKYSKEFEPCGDNWTLRYDHNYDIFTTYYTRYIQVPFALYFESEEIMRKAIEEVGEGRIKKYLFRVED